MDDARALEHTTEIVSAFLSKALSKQILYWPLAQVRAAWQRCFCS
jgi:hypothetical protein